MNSLDKLNNTINDFQVQVKEIETVVDKQKKLNNLVDKVDLIVNDVKEIEKKADSLLNASEVVKKIGDTKDELKTEVTCQFKEMKNTLKIDVNDTINNVKKEMEAEIKREISDNNDNLKKNMEKSFTNLKSELIYKNEVTQKSLESINNETNIKINNLENEMNNNIEERIDKLSKENKVLSGIAIILLLINLALIFIIK
ncbi:MAG: hypothetical protein MSA89_08700 [Clostridium sp.]|nr:hypothetical protein [Clostridium sp.]